MAKQSNNSVYQPKDQKAKGKKSKKSQNNKNSKFYEKQYRGQGRK